jgi:preprotein translocase subunit SecE
MKNTIAASADDQPERRKETAQAGWVSSLGTWPGRTKAFLGDVRAEMKRVSWPNFAQIRATTIVVLVTVFFFGVYFGILDWIFNNVVRRILRFGS